MLLWAGVSNTEVYPSVISALHRIQKDYVGQTGPKGPWKDGLQWDYIPPAGDALRRRIYTSNRIA